MGILAEAWNPRLRAASQSPDALNEFWYTPDPSGYILESGMSGVTLSADTLLRCGTVLAAVRFRGDSWAMCPPSTYRRTSRGREEDSNHYSQLVLRNPNRWQTGNRWRHLNGVWMALWGNAYNEMVAGPRSFADELRPMHPSVTRVVDQRADGSLLYLHQRPGQDEVRLGQEMVLHFRDLSTDGLQGVSMHRLIRNIVGIALLAEKHQTTFLSKGTRVSGLLVPTQPLNPDQRKVLRESVNEDLGGSRNTGMLGILPHGVDLKQISLTHREAQFAELADHTVGAILRFLGVPGFVIGYQGDKANTYASAKETAQEALRHTVLPGLTNIEAEEEKALLVPGDGRQIKHNMDVLLRVNTKDRYDALFKAAGRPWITGNEARAVEDLNPSDQPDMDEVLLPSNMMGVVDDGGQAKPSPGSPEQPDGPTAAVTEEARLAAAALTIQKIYLGVGVVLSAEEARKMVTETGFELPGPLPPGAKADAKQPQGGARPEPPAPPAEDDSDEKQGGGAAGASEVASDVAAQARWLAQSAASQVVRREIAAITDKAPKHARDPEGWRAWVDGYYQRHAGHVVKALNVPEAAARDYCEGQAAALLGGGLSAMETWERDVVPRLVTLALGTGR